MIQTGTFLKVVDNSGAKKALCIKVQKGYRRRYAYIGDIILVSIKSLRSKRRDVIKVKKGEMYKALVLRVKTPTTSFSGDSFSSNEISSIILLTKQKKILGTRIFGSITKKFRFTNFLKVLSLSSGSFSS